MSFLKAAAATAAPSPTPSVSSQSSKKRPRPDDTPVYSQPASTGSGYETVTRIVYALDYLKEKDRALTFLDIWKHLSIQIHVEGQKPQPAPKGGKEWATLQHILQRHEKVDYDPAGFDGQGSYRYRPKHNVRSADELKGFLQRQTSSVGIKVSELKDGWPGAIDAINELEAKGELLVTRNQKTAQPLLVWQNDPSLLHSMDAEFKSMWLGIPLPQNPDDLRSRLVAANLNPTSAPREPKQAVKPKDKKKKTQRKGKTTSNTHMIGVFRDYSDKKKV